LTRQKLKLGTTLGDAMKFATGKFWNILGMTWPSFLVLIAVLLGGIFWILDLDMQELVGLGTTLEEAAFPSMERDDADAPIHEPSEAEGSGDEGDVPKPDADKQTDKEGQLDDDLGELNPFESLPPETLRRAIIAAPLLFIAVLVLQSVPLVGYTRMQLRGKAPILWPFYFRLGPTEIRLTITLFLISLIILIASVAAMIPVAILIGIASTSQAGGSEPSPGIIAAVIGITLIYMIAFLPWLWSRLALAIPICVNEGELGISRAWQMSSGHGLTLSLSVIIGFIVVLVISTFAQIVIEVLSLPLNMAAGSMPDLELGLTLAVVIPTMLALIALQAFQNAFLYGLFTGAYKHLTAEDQE